MGHLTRLGLGVAWLSWTGIATAEGAPAPSQWSAPAPPPATPTPSASAPPPSLAHPLPDSPSAPAPAAPSPAPAPAPALAPAPYPYPYPYPYLAYPPPPGYGYYYPAPELPKLRFPDNSAVSSTPFIDALVLGVSWENRFSQFLCLGAQVGVFVGGRVRLTLRGAVPTNKLNDEYYRDQGNAAQSKDAAALFGASAGVVAVSTHNFALSPGLAFATTDVSDYGSMVGLSMPLEWVTDNGLRLGLEVNIGRSFAGQTRFTDCLGGACPATPPQDRPAGTGFWMQFQIGYGFNHPAPLPPARPARTVQMPR